MKQRIYNGHSLEFYNEDNSKKGELRISGSDIVINPMDSDGTVIFGEEGSINDIEVGASGTAVDFTFVGGGAITSNGGTLTVGKTGDTVDLSNATIGTITASIFKGGQFIGDGSGLTSTPSTFTHITASGNISASGAITANGFNTVGNISFTGTTNNEINSIVNLTLNADSDSNSGDAYRNIIFENRGTETARITAAGNLGIGTSTPTEALQVAGNISASGDITLNETLNFGATTGEIRTSNANGSGNLEIIPDGTLKLGNSRTDNVYIGRQDNTNYTTRIYGGNSTENIKTGLNYVELNVPVTASGNISASGNIFGQKFGNDLHNHFDFSTDNQLHYKVNNVNKLLFNQSRLAPAADLGTTLGSSTLRWKELNVNHITASGNISGSSTSTLTMGGAGVKC